MGMFYEPFSLRIPQELREKIKVIAAAERRSINRQMEYILKAYVRRYEAVHGEIVVEM